MKAIFHKFYAYKSRRLWLERMKDERFKAFLLDEKEYSHFNVTFHRLVMEWNPDKWIDQIPITAIMEYDRGVVRDKRRNPSQKPAGEK